MGLDQRVNNSLRESIESFDFVIKEMITEKQLYEKGEDGKKNKLAPYTLGYVRIKIKLNQPYDRTTLKLKGDFHASVEVIAYEDRMEIRSDVKHAKWLVKRYGKNILAPQAENMREFFVKYVIPDFRKRLLSDIAAIKNR